MRIELVTELSGKRAIGLSGIKALADAGDTKALNLLGEWLIMGFECSPDANYAVRCFEQAARKGNTQAMLNLGICYIEGHGVKKNFAAAERWIRAADELGDSEAQGICEELYLSTIGSHKPDLRAYVDFLFTKFPKGDVYLDEKLMKREIIAEYILESAGKSKEDIEKLKGKITENDILAYESMNDLYYGDKEESEDDPLDQGRYCSFLVDNLSSLDRERLAKRLKVLYHLVRKKSKTHKTAVQSLSKECCSKLKCDETLTWYERAMFDISEDMLCSFDDASIGRCLAAIEERLHAIEEDELDNLYSQCANDRTALISARKKLHGSTSYAAPLLEKWIEIMTERICQLEDQAIERLYASAGSDYQRLVDLHKDISESQYENTTRQKWLLTVSQQISKVQENCLKELCKNLEVIPYKSLIQLHDRVQHSFCFDAGIQTRYLQMISKPIDEYENRVLSEICADIDDRISSEYSDILARMRTLRFKQSNLQKYVDIVTEKMKNALIIESCTEEKLENYDLDQLNDRVKAIHFSSLPTETKKRISQRITYYSDLVYECKDKYTLSLLDKCSQNSIVHLALRELKEIKDAIRDHQRLPASQKEVLLAATEERIRIMSFEDRVKKADKNYDQLVALFNDLENAGLPKTVRDQNTVILKERILDAQTEALEDLKNHSFDDAHSEIVKRIEKARHYSFDVGVCNKTIACLEARIDELESIRLEKMCYGLDRMSNEDLNKLREAIGNLGYKRKNTVQYLDAIEYRQADIRFNELTAQCTDSHLLDTRFGLKECEDLLFAFEPFKYYDKPFEPYVERVEALLKVKKAHNEEVLNLYLGDISETRVFVESTVPGNTGDFFVYGSKIDSASKHWNTRLLQIEKPIFIYDSAPTIVPLKLGICVTNLHIYIAETTSVVHAIPIEQINEIKPSKFSYFITIASTKGKYSCRAFDEYERRVVLSNLLIRMVNYLVPKQRSISGKYSDLKQIYTQTYLECLKKHPVPERETVSCASVCENQTATAVDNTDAQREPQAPPATSDNASFWLCSCGTTNKKNFCLKCGNKRESGIALWACSCGNLNKGKFCSKCGSPRKE